MSLTLGNNVDTWNCNTRRRKRCQGLHAALNKPLIGVFHFAISAVWSNFGGVLDWIFGLWPLGNHPIIFLAKQPAAGGEASKSLRQWGPISITLRQTHQRDKGKSFIFIPPPPLFFARLHRIATLLSTHKLKLYMIMLPWERHCNKRVKIPTRLTELGRRVSRTVCSRAWHSVTVSLPLVIFDNNHEA